MSELMPDVEMSHGHHSPRMNHSDLTLPYTNSNGNMNETETKPMVNLPEEIFGLAGDLTRWELRGDSFRGHRPLQFNANPVTSTFNQNSNGQNHHSNNDSFFSNIEVHNVFSFQERPSKFGFGNRRSGELDSMMTDHAYEGPQFPTVNNQISNNLYQTTAAEPGKDELDHFPARNEELFGSFGPSSYQHN